MIIVLNSFSISMLSNDNILKFKKIGMSDISDILIEDNWGERRNISPSVREFVSFIGHEDTARILSQYLSQNIYSETGIVVPMNRSNYTFSDSDIVIVAQYSGGRLPEGCKTLPEGATFNFFLVSSVRQEFQELSEKYPKVKKVRDAVIGIFEQRDFESEATLTLEELREETDIKVALKKKETVASVSFEIAETPNGVYAWVGYKNYLSLNGKVIKSELFGGKTREEIEQKMKSAQ